MFSAEADWTRARSPAKEARTLRILEPVCMWLELEGCTSFCRRC
jgi:hypothetical protein